MSAIPRSDQNPALPQFRRLPLAGAVGLAVIATLVATASNSPPHSGAAPWPVGKDVGAVAFDCVIEEDAPLAAAKTVLFLEYAVSPQSIAYSILWAEPCWGSIHFPCPPTGTSLYADDSRFVVRHALNDVQWQQSLPAEPRGRFMHTCGNYPLVDARIAYQEARGRRLRVSDVPALEANARCGGIGSPLPDRSGRPPTVISVSGIEPGRISFTFQMDQPTEQRVFEYRLEEGKLKTISSESFAVKVPVGGFEIEATTPEFPAGIVIEQLPARYHADGRMALVEFSSQAIGGVAVDLPHRIRVGTHKRQVGGPAPLRRVTMSNYRRLPEKTTVETIGSRFTSDPLFEREQTFRKLTANHWNRPAAEVDPAAAAWLRDFADDCLRMAHDEPRLPVKLKLLYMAIAADLIVGNGARADAEGLPARDRALREAGLDTIADLTAAQLAAIRANWRRAQGDFE